MNGRSWTAEEDAYLMERLDNVIYVSGTERLAYILNRSIPEIRTRACRFKKRIKTKEVVKRKEVVKKRGGHQKNWTEEELRILKESWDSKSSFEISKIIQRSSEAIRKKAKSGLRLKGRQKGVYLQSSPNRSETILDELLQDNFPNEYRFNGDYSQGVTLGGLVPDWININGRKQVIELFGEYWHDGERKKVRWKATEFGRKAVFSQLGFGCLIIWSKELRHSEDVIEKIRGFQEGTSLLSSLKRNNRGVI